MKRLVYIHNVFRKQELQKDCFAFTRYLAKHFALQPAIVYHITNDNQKLPDEFRGVRLIPLKYKGKLQNFSFNGAWYLFWYIIKKARKIDVLMRVHISYQTFIILCLYKVLNPIGRTILKTDGLGIATALKRPSKGLIRSLSNKIIRKIISIIFYLSNQVCVETPETLSFLENQFPIFRHKIKLILNGFDEELFKTLTIKEMSLSQKENLIIASGRIGSKQKNTELLLRAISLIDLKDWKVVFIGPIEKEERHFQSYINNFFLKRPQLLQQVLFTNEINDRKDYFDWFNRAKVFVHTAIYESYGIVLTEAARFHLYIISSDVGIANEMIQRTAGELIPTDNPVYLARVIQKIINEETLIEKTLFDKQKTAFFSWENQIKKISLDI